MALGFPWLGIGGYGYIHRKFPFYSGKLKTNGMKKQVGAVIDNPNGIFPAQGAYRKFPLSRYIKHRFKKIDAYICDELHEYSGESAQGEAMAEIAGIAKKVIAMTATLINGYAKGTFYLLFRLKPRLMLADGFKYSDARKFCQRYGVVESIYETPETKYNVASKNRTQKVREKFLPGISPIVYSRYLMENTVFLSLYDMAKDLPDYEEIPVACEMSESVEKEYRHMEDEFRTVMRKDRRLANKLLSPYLNLLTAYPDQPYGHAPVIAGDFSIVPKDFTDEPNDKLNNVLELIADGRHIPKEHMLLAYKIKGADKIALITDAMRAAGTNDTESVLGGRDTGVNVVVKDGVAQLPDLSFYAGSVGTMDRALRVAHLEYGIHLVDVVKMMSLTPAKIAKCDSYKGSLTVGKDADIVIMNNCFEVENVLQKGALFSIV